MSEKQAAKTGVGFQVEDPRVVFEIFSKEEIRRFKETDPGFDGPLYDEAVQLVLARLGNGTKSSAIQEESL